VTYRSQGEREMREKFESENPKESVHFGELDIYGRILKSRLKNRI
jgi:hypothetical protein